MTYPRTVILADDKLKKLLIEKEDLVLVGREKSQHIEDLEAELQQLDEEMQSVEGTVDNEDLKAESEQITADFNAVMERMEDVKKRIYERMSGIVPKELKQSYDAKRIEKEAFEKERNKIALKVQKKSDKIIPLGRKLMAPFLQDEYEDFDTLRLENGEVVATIFSHMEDFKARHAAKK